MLGLSLGVFQDKVLRAAMDDVPDSSHCRGTPPSIRPWMVEDPISPHQLSAALVRRGDAPPHLKQDELHPAGSAAPMGRTGALSLRGGATGETLGNEFENFPRKDQLILVHTVFEPWDKVYLYWGYMNDFAIAAQVEL